MGEENIYEWNEGIGGCGGGNGDDDDDDDDGGGGDVGGGGGGGSGGGGDDGNEDVDGDFNKVFNECEFRIDAWIINYYLISEYIHKKLTRQFNSKPWRS